MRDDDIGGRFMDWLGRAWMAWHGEALGYQENGLFCLCIEMNK